MTRVQHYGNGGMSVVVKSEGVPGNTAALLCMSCFQRDWHSAVAILKPLSFNGKREAIWGARLTEQQLDWLLRELHRAGIGIGRKAVQENGNERKQGKNGGRKIRRW